jgi:hypothetical protein
MNTILNTPKQTLSERMKPFREETMLNVCRLLHISIEEWSEVVFELGTEYVDQLMYLAPDHASIMLQTSSFWKWWKMDWWTVDRHLYLKLKILHDKHNAKTSELLAEWKYQHSFEQRYEVKRIKPAKEVRDEVDSIWNQTYVSHNK